VAIFSIYLGQSQVAVGFTLTLMTRDLAYFLGNPYSRQPGPQVSPFPVPALEDLPFLGPVFFNHNFFVYFALILIGFSWWYMHRTRPGLELISVGEHPGASYARGIDPRKIQLFYSVCGGLLVGLAGAAFSLSLKPGWGRPQGAEGTGWIVLAIVIFGGWNPLKVAAGAFLFSLLQVLGIYFQGRFPSVPAQVFQVAPFPLMIFTLLLMNIGQKESLQTITAQKPLKRFINALFSGSPPRALGKAYNPD
jgi:simple sugar transport system permease protein